MKLYLIGFLAVTAFATEASAAERKSQPGRAEMRSAPAVLNTFESHGVSNRFDLTPYLKKVQDDDGTYQQTQACTESCDVNAEWDAFMTCGTIFDADAHYHCEQAFQSAADSCKQNCYTGAGG